MCGVEGFAEIKHFARTAPTYQGRQQRRFDDGRDADLDLLHAESRAFRGDANVAGGRKFEPAELVRRATGAPMSTAPYLAYLRTKYGELYRLPESKSS